ncbi:MAG: ABC transporter permease [Gammaproteobacteria bacterium]|nr:ABC transporter permease [Gammaproteobacteria bacterium]MDH3410627.1 ABC transporter permease [Gammaproteobacteria bacterium]
MSFALTSFKKDLSRWRQDLLQTAIWLAIPLTIGGLITMLMSGDGAQPHGVLLVADQDESFLSELIAGAYSAGDLGELISVEKTTVEEGTTRVNAGEASGLLIIPEGFGDAFLDAEAITLTLRTNPSQTILPGIITDVTEIVLDAGFYAQALFGDDIDSIQKLVGESSDAAVAAIAVAIQNKIEIVAPRLFPPVINVAIVEPPPSEPRPSFALLYLPGIVLMAVMFSSNGLASDFWVERDRGTLRRLVFSPGQLGSFVIGKALAAAVVIAIIGGLTLVLGFLYHGVSWTKFPSSLVWIALSGVALFAWFAALQMLFSNQNTASVISSLLLFPLLMAGGSFFPLAVMPGWIAAIGRLSPNGFVADRLTSEITEVGAWIIDASSWLIVAAAAASGLAICAWRLRTGFARA